MNRDGRDGPFLSVLVPVVRADQALRETLLCIAGQHDDDFEVLLLAAHLDGPGLARLDEVVADQPRRLARRVRVVRAGDGRPGALRNAGLDVATGRYVVVLGEGDLPLGRWVATLHDGEPSTGTPVLRALAVTQPSTTVEVRGRAAVRATGTPIADAPPTFSLWQHALEPLSPSCSWAWPRSLVQERDVRYDPAVTDDADWELLVRVAELVGVQDTGAVAAVHRELNQPGSTPAAGSDTVALAAREVIDSRPLVLPPGEAGRLRDERSESAASQALREELDRTREELRLTHDHAANLQAMVDHLTVRAEKAERRHAKELARLRRTAQDGTAHLTEDGEATADGGSGRSWLTRRRSRRDEG